MGVVSKNCFHRFLHQFFAALHAQTLVLTDVQTPFLGTPLVPLNNKHSSRWRWCFQHRDPVPLISKLTQRHQTAAKTNNCLFHRPIALTLGMSMNIDIRGQGGSPTLTTSRIKVHFADTGIMRPRAESGSRGLTCCARVRPQDIDVSCPVSHPRSSSRLTFSMGPIVDNIVNGNHKSENPLEDATENILDDSSKHPLDK